MLLGAALLPTAKAEAATFPGFMEICTPRGIVLQPFDQAASPEAENPDPDSGSQQWEDCPICSAFGQLSLGMPSGLAVIGQESGADQPVHRPVTFVRGQDITLPQTRAPPQPS